MNEERETKHKRLLNTRISAEVIGRLEDEGFRGPVRKRHRRQLDEEYDSCEYQQSLSCLAYAKDLCENYTFDRNIIKLRFPFKYPMLCDTLYLGGILISMCIWSGHVLASMISTPFC